MHRSFILLAGATLFAVSLCNPAFSQGSPQTVALTKVDPASLATGDGNRRRSSPTGLFH